MSKPLRPETEQAFWVIMFLFVLVILALAAVGYVVMAWDRWVA